MRDTLYALSSGAPPSAVAVIRVSGPQVRAVLEAIAGGVPAPRRVSLRALREPETGALLDRALVLWFPGPKSFTGEDMAELQIHGGRAVAAALLAALGRLPGLRAAEPGAFTRRAFEAGRLDLTAVEGLADLIAADTEQQRRQALRAADGALAAEAEGWRTGLLAARAAIEADLDFSDEEDVPADGVASAIASAAAVRASIATVLAQGERGERVREGFDIALMGPPNAGKSSLLNALARRDVAIVTPVAGTTRDVIEVHLDLGGHAVTIADTAGLRAVDDVVEAEGVRRATARGRRADLVLWLDETGSPAPMDLATSAQVVALQSKADLAGLVDGPDVGADGGFPAAISTATGFGLAALVVAIGATAEAALGGEPALVTRARQRDCLRATVSAIDAALGPGLPPEVVADGLRMATDALGRLTGRVDVEEVLGAIFSSFCIGK